jgi:hypothetical protein
MPHLLADQNYGAHSAWVEMRLIINGTSISISQMGPDFLFIEGSHDHPPGEATIVLQVDDTERRWQVNLPDGISKASTRVALALRGVARHCHQGRSADIPVRSNVRPVT